MELLAKDTSNKEEETFQTYIQTLSVSAAQNFTTMDDQYVLKACLLEILTALTIFFLFFCLLLLNGGYSCFRASFVCADTDTQVLFPAATDLVPGLDL